MVNVTSVRIEGDWVRIARGNSHIYDLTFDEVKMAAHVLREHLLNCMPPEMPPHMPDEPDLAPSDLRARDILLGGAVYRRDNPGRRGHVTRIQGDQIWVRWYDGYVTKVSQADLFAL